MGLIATKLKYGLWEGNPDVEVEFTKSQVIAGIPGTLFCIWYVLKKHWLANNTLGLAFSIQVMVGSVFLFSLLRL